MNGANLIQDRNYSFHKKKKKKNSECIRKEKKGCVRERGNHH
jgi:hypothetical protein